MWLGTGTMRRRGRACTARTVAESSGEPQFPQILSWEVTDGRWAYDGAGWVRQDADTARLYKDSAGNVLGYLIEDAETFHSAPWHDPEAPHGAGDHAYLTRTFGTDTLAYAGQHGEPDIHGGTGKGVLITQGATAGGTFTANNVTAAVASGNLIRVEALFSIPDAAGTANTFILQTAGRSGTPGTYSVSIAYDAAGAITGWGGTINAAAMRAGYSEAGVRSDGGKVWFAWFEYYASGTGVLAPGIRLANAIAGRKVMLHDLRILANPQTAPKAVPVLAASKSFAADTMVTGAAGTKGVLFHRLARCRTRITDGKLSVADGWARSGPYIPYETRVEVVDSEETSDVPGILPNEYEAVDFTPWPTNVASWRVTLGPGYYNHRIVPTFEHITTDYTVTSAFKADPALMAQVERFSTRENYVKGALTLDDLIVFSRASEVTTQLEQQDLPTGTAALNFISAGGSISARRSLFAGHPVTHSRARAEEQEDDAENNRAWIGVNAFTPKGGSGISLNLSGSHFWRMGRAALIDTAGTASTLTVTVDDVFFDQVWSDFLYFDTGTFTVNMNRVLFGRATYAQSSLWQSRKEIEVDTGSGWQPLSASGLTVASLPFGRKATFAGTWDFGAGAFTAAPDASRHVHVRYWKRGSWGLSTQIDRPGYQWHSSQAHYPDEDRNPAIGDVYEIRQASGPSPEKPWVRLTYDYGSWKSGPVWVAGTGPAVQMTGTHADCLQTNITTGIYESITGSNCVIMGKAQGMFVTGNQAMGANDTDNRSAAFDNFIVLSDQSWSFHFSFSKTANSLCSVSNALTLPMASRFRQPGGTTSTLGIGAAGPNNTISLTNVFAGYRNGVSAVSASNGGTITGSHTRVGIGEISGYAVTPPSGTPKITDMLDGRWLDPFSYAVRDDIDPLDAEFAFTPYAESASGMALNAILAGAQGTHDRWDTVKARIAKYHRRPDHTAIVAASSPVGTVVVAGLGASDWEPLWSGNEKGYFSIENREIKVARALTGINQCWLLETGKNELVLLDIR